MLYELLIPAGLAIAGWTQSTLLSLQTWESVRFARRRLSQSSTEQFGEGDASEKVAVLVPCKGADDDLRSNLQPLFQQSHANYEIVFLVESPEDRAHPVLVEMIDENRHLVEACIVLTGRAIESGQKVHNLLSAVESLPEGTTTLAFVDSDACPKPEWLNRLVAELDRPETGAVTGYRWMVPASDHPANLFVYSLNSSLAGLLGPGGHYFVWGGSWAIRRSTFEDIGLREAWHGTLSDDLVASRAIHSAGLKVRFSPHSVSCSRIDGNWGATFEFIRRQYVIARRYAPRLWRLGVANGVAAQLGIWGSLIYALLANDRAGRTIAGLTFVLLYTMAIVRGHWRQQLVGCYAPNESDRLQTARRSDIWLSPLFGLANLFFLAGSAFGSQIQWRGIRYWISPGGRILTMGRQPTEHSDDEPVILQFPTLPLDGESLPPQRERRAA